MNESVYPSYDLCLYIRMLAVIVDQPSTCLKPAMQINERQYRRINNIASLV